MDNRAYLDYMPEYMGRIREIKAIAAAVDEMLAKTSPQNDLVIREGIINTAEDVGLEGWEDALGIPHTGTAEERREEILSYFAGNMPYTFKGLKNILESLCGITNVKLAYGSTPYTLEVKLSQHVISRKRLISGLLEKILPANISFSVIPDYNTHYDLSRSTHQRLGTFTHSELKRKEI